MLTSALDKVVTFAGEVLFGRKIPTSITRETTPDERTDLRISGQPEVPCTKDKKAEQPFVISSSTRPIQNSPNKSMLIAYLMKNYAQKHQRQSNTILCQSMIQNFMLYKTAIWNDMRFQRSRIVCNAKDTRDQAKHLVFVVVCCRASPKRPKKKQAEQRISSRYIMYVLSIHDSALKNAHRGRRQRKPEK